MILIICKDANVKAKFLLNHSSQLASSLYFATSYSKNMSRMLVGKYDFLGGQTFLLHLLQFWGMLGQNCWGYEDSFGTTFITTSLAVLCNCLSLVPGVVCIVYNYQTQLSETDGHEDVFTNHQINKKMFINLVAILYCDTGTLSISY